MVSPSSRRAVKWVVEQGLGNAAQACRALGLARSSYYLVGQKRPSSQKLDRKIIALSEEEHPRFGDRRITALMRRKGIKTSPLFFQATIPCLFFRSFLLIFRFASGHNHLTLAGSIGLTRLRSGPLAAQLSLDTVEMANLPQYPASLPG
jgi:hypothetical protein